MPPTTNTYVEVLDANLTQSMIDASTSKGTVGSNTARKSYDGYTLLEFEGTVPSECDGYTQRNYTDMDTEVDANTSDRWETT